METLESLGSAEVEGFAEIERNPPLRRAHSISREKFVAVLTALRSPAAAEGEALAVIPERYGLDRGIALAFFVHESSAGRAGIVQDYQTRNWGNLRRLQREERGELVKTRSGQFAKYVSWAAGLEDWCELMVNVYEGRWGLTTLGEVLHNYAPRADQNDPEAYARKVVKHIRGWQGEMKRASARLVPAREGARGVERTVIVTAAAGLNIRAGCGTSFDVVGKLARGALVQIDEEREGWLRLSDGQGYIAKAFTA